MATGEKRRVQSNYDDLGGEGYTLRYREEQEAKYERIFSHVNVDLGDLVLDDGCGSGMLMERLYSPTVGLDLSSELLRTASSKLRPLQSVVQGDAERLPFRSGVFDAAISVTLIQNTPSPVDVFGEIKRVTKPGGRIAVTALKHAYSEEEFVGILMDAGLGYVRVAQSGENQDWFAYGTR